MKKTTKALILVDLQNDFCKGGALELKDADTVIQVANELIPMFDVIVATQEWHPANHGSFAANHLWRKPGQVIDLNGSAQTLYPIHCVQNSFGAMLHRHLQLPDETSSLSVFKIIQKGTDPNIDSYSGFFDNGRQKQTELHNFLSLHGVKEVYIMGLATDYCVKFTALDALSLGYRTYLIEDGSRGVNLNEGDVETAVKYMAAAGVTITNKSSVDSLLAS